MATTTSTHATSYNTHPHHHEHDQPTKDDSPPSPKQKLALDQLAVVRFVAQIAMVQTVTLWSKRKWEEGRKLWYLWWFLAATEIAVLQFWILIHSLPWPDWALEYLHRIDEAIVKALEWMQGKIDWVSSHVNEYVVPPITYVWDKLGPSLEKDTKSED